MTQTIIGARGPVSNSSTKELLNNGKNIRLVSRRKIEITKKLTWVGADLKNYH